MILVTGGTGLVGSHLLYYLTEAGNNVCAIYRDDTKIDIVKKTFRYYTNNPESLFDKIDWIRCDINDISKLEKAFKNITHVYHCAALISFDPRDRKKLSKSNLEGTSNIVNLSIVFNIKKLCYVSSIATIGNTADGSLANETTEFNDNLANVYALSKHQAEMEVWRGSQENLNIIIVNPGFILGPGFWNTGSGKIFWNIFKGLKFFPPKGTGFVGVNDVVKSMIALMNSTIINQNFIVVAKNLSYKEVFATIAEYLGKKPPQTLLKNWMLAILWRLDWLKSLLTGSERILSKKMAQSFDIDTIYNTKKIEESIEFKYEDINDVIQFCTSIFLKENR